MHAEVILELLGSFTLERRVFRSLSRANFCKSMSLFNKPVLYMNFQFAGDFFSDRYPSCRISSQPFH